MAETNEWYDIVCSKCGEEAQIPFEPDRDNAVYCQDCYQNALEERRESAPRRTHGTRVQFNITCAECGADDTLDYVPKGKSPDELLCRDCFEEQANEASHYHTVKEEREEERRQVWEFECDECGRVDTLNFKPKEDREYLCTRCFYEHESPSDTKAPKQAVSRGVYVRKPDE